MDSDNEDVEDDEHLADSNKAFQPFSILDSARVTHLSTACSWEDMEDDHGNRIRDQFFRRVTYIPLNE